MHTFNPAAVVMGDSVYVLYRAEDSSGQMRVGGHTSRLGLAASADGIHFVKYKEPVLFPANDNQKRREWKGGCEDPRLVRTREGTFVLTYTQYNRLIPRLGVATSTDLKHWVKHGSAFKGRAAVDEHTQQISRHYFCEIVDGELRAAQINGRVLDVCGRKEIATGQFARPLALEAGQSGIKPQPDKYDSQLTEAGPPAVITNAGVVLLYNGKNGSTQGDTSITPGTYAVRQLFSTKMIFGIYCT